MHTIVNIIVQILILVITFISYVLVRKLKDNGSVNTSTQNTQNPWQAKVYKNKFAKKIIDLFIPKDGTKDYKKMTDLLTDAASIRDVLLFPTMKPLN